MDEHRLSWTAFDQAKVVGSVWYKKQRQARAVVVIVHGMGEHRKRYVHVAQRLVDEGYVVAAFDQRGHGETDGKRGHVAHYDQLIEDLDAFVEQVESAAESLSIGLVRLPWVIYGHSMGGNVTLTHTLSGRHRDKWRGIIASSPWLRLAFAPTRLDLLLGALMNRIWPSFTLRRPLLTANLTADPEFQASIRNDGLRHPYISARFFFGVQAAGRTILDCSAESFNDRPILFMHGDDDRVTSIHATAQLAAKLGSKTRTFIRFSGGKHELHNDVMRNQVLDRVSHWLNELLC